MVQEQRLSKLLIEELCDGDKNCPFRIGTPLFVVINWSVNAEREVPQSPKQKSSIHFEYLQMLKKVI